MRLRRRVLSVAPAVALRYISQVNRSDQIARLTDTAESWDVVIIGGGATGLGIAVDAASRGYRTALLEQADFAAGTSSKSTKLIHGGVRYLRGGEIGLVRESLRERGRLLRNAPGLVTRLSFVVPAYRWYERGFYGIGLTLYDALAGRAGLGKTRHLSREAAVQAIPNIGRVGLRGGTLYYDAQFDDAGLCIALAKTAVQHGASVVNRVKVSALQRNGGRVTGVIAEDLISGEQLPLKARAVINATGVFTDEIRHLDDPNATGIIEPSQGIHLVLDPHFLGSDTAMMIPSTTDGRVLFVIPWMGKILLGTTDTAGVSPSLDPRPLDEEIDYLLAHVAPYLHKSPTRSDVRAIFAGLRPLVKPKTSRGGTASISRSHDLFVSDSGLITITGGKWTTYRQMAEDAVDRAATVAGLPIIPCCTRDLTLLGGEIRSEREGILLDEALPYTEEDVRRAIREEMALSVDDILSRRLRASMLDQAAASRITPTVARILQEEGLAPF
jgi:glycerol-3-phosphate dehydrogenase